MKKERKEHKDQKEVKSFLFAGDISMQYILQTNYISQCQQQLKKMTFKNTVHDSIKNTKILEINLIKAMKDIYT